MKRRYEQRLENDLQDIRVRVAKLGAAVEESVGKAVRALLGLDRELASRVILDDYAVNRTTRAIDSLCHVFVALHLPSAGILRYISSVLRLTREVERVGDYAVGIAREVIQLTRQVPAELARDFEMLAGHSQHLLRQAMRAFNEANDDLARATKQTALQEQAIFDRVYGDLLLEGEKGLRPVRDIFALLSSFRRMVRITDQAKNICEETLFATTGEAKQPKVFRVLFLDEKNDCRSVMAEAIARKGFADSGHYESAGWQPAESVRPEVATFLGKRGHDISGMMPRALGAGDQELAACDVIVSLQGEVRKHVSRIPFHTVMLEWNIDAAIGGAEDELDEARLEEIYTNISQRMHDLMAILLENLAN